MGLGKKNKSNGSEMSVSMSAQGDVPEEPSPEVLALRAAITSQKAEVMRYRRESHEAKLQVRQGDELALECRIFFLHMCEH